MTAAKLDIRGAIERAVELPFHAYRNQVVAFLDPDALDLYDNERAWSTMQHTVFDILMGLQ